MSGLLKPRAHTFRGHVDARGFLFDVELIGEAEARRRVFALWSPQATIFQVDEQAWAMLLPETIHVRAEAAPGAPLVELENELASAPLEKDERHPSAGRSDAILVVRGGRTWVTELDEESSIDPATWIDLSNYSVAEAITLGEPAIATPAIAVRAELDLAAELELAPAPQTIENVEQIIHELSGTEEGRHGAGSTFWSRIVAALARFGANLLSFSKPQAPSAREPVHISRAAPEGLLERLRQRLEALASKLTRINAFGELVGRMHAGYLARMMEMFEQGNLDEALRHAIPLKDPRSDELLPSGPRTLRLPEPRSSLNISSRGGPTPTSAIGLREDLFSTLRRMYRRAFERLEREQRIEEAAFVLAELLEASEEAVAFLEKHGKFELAAKLAESRNLEPGLIVRQYFLAGDIQRAVMIARNRGVFADAVHRLSSKKEHRAQAEALRVLWAQSLAAAGEYGAAVDTIWPVEGQRALAAPWIEAAIAAGGPAGARMLIRSLTLAPETFEEVRDAAIALLSEDSSFDNASTRAALALALLTEPWTPQLQVLARLAIRAIVRDEALWETSIGEAELRALIGRAGDEAFRADLPPRWARSGAATFEDSDGPRHFRFRADDCGTLRISDVARLPSGRLLVALGELGVRYLTPDGRLIAAFDQPADSLVVSDHGDRAITVASRGDVQHIGRIDLAYLRASHWCDLSLACWADSFDGSMWFVAQSSPDEGRDILTALDATRVKVEAMWTLGDVAVFAISRSPSLLSAIIESENTLGVWYFDLPGPTLRLRWLTPGLTHLHLLPEGMLAGFIGKNWMVFQNEELVTGIELGADQLIGRLHIHRNHLAMAQASEDGISVVLADTIETSEPRIEYARIELEGARKARLNLDASTLIAFDDRGRIVVFDHQRCRIVRILRVS